MLQLVELRLHLGCDPGIAMADADGDDAAEEVEVLIAIHVPDVLHAPMVHGHRLGVVIRH